MKVKLNIDLSKTLNELAESFTSQLNGIGKTGTIREVIDFVLDSLEFDYFGSEGLMIRHSFQVRNGFVIGYGPLRLTFKITTKDTGELVTVSKLRKMKVYEFNKIEYDYFYIEINPPNFIMDESKNYGVITDDRYYNRPTIADNRFSSKKNGHLTMDNILNNVKNSDITFMDMPLRDYIINQMAQPYYKSAELLDQEKWDIITGEVGKNNNDLLEKVITDIWKYN